MRTIGWIEGLLFLSVCSIWDIRYRAVPVRFLAAGGIATALTGIFIRENMILLCMAGGVFGSLFLLVSRWTKEAFGYGDSCIITVLGIQLGLWELCAVLWGAFLLSAVFSAAYGKKNKWNKKTAFPFIPFLMAAYIGAWIL